MLFFACWEGKNGVIITILFFNILFEISSYLELKKSYFKDIVFILFVPWMGGFINWCLLIQMQVKIVNACWAQVKRMLGLKFRDLSLNPVITLTGCVTLGKLFNFCKPVYLIYKIIIYLNSCFVAQSKI